MANDPMTPTPDMIAMAERVANATGPTRDSLWAASYFAALTAIMEVTERAASSKRIAEIYVSRMWESCERATFYTTLKTCDGLTITPSAFATGSIYNNFEGLSEAEALDRALIEAATWGDLLEIAPTPYVVDGQPVEPSCRLSSYRYQRELLSQKQPPSATGGI